MRVVEIATGCPVRAPKRRDSVDDPHLAGPGGAFIREWFARVDPGRPEASLSRLVRRAKEELKDDPEAAAREANLLELAELPFLRGARPIG